MFSCQQRYFILVSVRALNYTFLILCFHVMMVTWSEICATFCIRLTYVKVSNKIWWFVILESYRICTGKGLHCKYSNWKIISGSSLSKGPLDNRELQIVNEGISILDEDSSEITPTKKKIKLGSFIFFMSWMVLFQDNWISEIVRLWFMLLVLISCELENKCSLFVYNPCIIIIHFR